MKGNFFWHWDTDRGKSFYQSMMDSTESLLDHAKKQGHMVEVDIDTPTYQLLILRSRSGDIGWWVLVKT